MKTILDFKCDKTDCPFYHLNEINRCTFYIGNGAGIGVYNCKERKK